MVKLKYIRSLWYDTKTRTVAIALAFILFVSSLTSLSANAYTVRINIDGFINSIVTLSMNVKNILTQANVRVEKEDVVDLSEFQEGVDNTKINVYKARNVIVKDGNNDEVKLIGNGTIATTLEKNNIEISEDDELNYCKEDKVSENMKIIIYRAFPVKLIVDGNTVPLKVASGTVEDALKKANIEIGEEDAVTPALNETVSQDTTINVVKTVYKDRNETISIPYTTQTKENPEMTAGQSKIEVSGVAGEKNVTYKDKFVGGSLIESKIVSESVSKNAVTEIKVVGTKKNIATSASGIALANGVKTISTLEPPADLQLNGLTPTKYKQVITGTASAYYGGGHTATGKSVRPGYIAVNPKQIPYGSKLWIVSNDGKFVYGYASAEDTGGFVKWTGSRSTVCDLYFSTKAECNNFGRRGVTIYVL